MQLALRLLESPALDVLITGESDFDALPEVMDAAVDAPGDTHLSPRAVPGGSEDPHYVRPHRTRNYGSDV